MSDVSKTNEALIEEARSSFKATNASASMIRRLADALEAATRVPVQGEPNDDREALIDAMKRGEKVRQAAWSAYGQEPDGEGTKPHSDNWYRAEALMAAGFSRATVPDAATELQRAWIAEDRAKFDRADAEAERDAALAAVERARAEVRLLFRNAEPEPGQAQSDVAMAYGAAASLIRAALDGAPEPEQEYRVEYQVPGGASHVTETVATFEEAYGSMLENIHGGTVMSRTEAIPAGPWEPVEGESKP